MGRANLRQSLSFSVVFATLVAGCASATVAAEAPQTAADTWPAKWCQAQPGNTKTQLVAIMGPPTVALPTQMSWTSAQHRFSAFFDTDGSVKQLDASFDALAAAEKGALKCAEVRTKRSVAAAAAVAKAPPKHSALLACAMVSEAEMSAILGAPVVARANDRFNGKTECIYKPTSGISPYVEFSVAWGDGRAAMAGMRLARKKEAGVADPYDGIGDEAGTAGPALMIRSGEDLVSIVFSGVPDTLAKAKRIFETAKRKM